MGPVERHKQSQVFEQEAEMLNVYHIDLLAQLEQQLRAVHHTMRHIEKMRSVKYRVGPELSNGQRAHELTDLSAEIDQLDEQFSAEHDCCLEMQRIIRQMQDRLAALRKHAVVRPEIRPTEDSSSGTES
jgi:uncharacterized protein with von Willebrand factor type A (vWA) domain